MPSTRRHLLKTAAAAATLLSTGRELHPQAQQPKLKFLIAGGHPGDPEYGCGGTIARLTTAGHDAVLLYLNEGAWQTPAPIRTAEARKACDILRARPTWAGQTDNRSIVDEAHFAAFQKIIEAEKPDAVFTHWPIDNHPDHRAITSLLHEAWNRLKCPFPIYYYEVSSGDDTLQFPAPTHFIDITPVADTKKAACTAHASQNPGYFYDLQDSVARFRGLESGHTRAEAFVLLTRSPYDVLPRAGLSSVV
ncbi:MAG TPA: PIG-L deacetylase family protein [Terracidiphilus sp.]|jgi:LmbE family N-acetylglucosaminyl deacetylase